MARRKNILTEIFSNLIAICLFLLPIGIVLKFIADNSDIFSNIALLVVFVVALIVLLFVMYYNTNRKSIHSYIAIVKIILLLEKDIWQ